MKLKFHMLSLALCAVFCLQSCDNDDNDSIAVPTELQNAFSADYPNATHVEWELKSGYYVADFRDGNDGYDTSAWYGQDGKWQMTEKDIPYSALPQEVKTAFENSDYKSWRVDDVDQLDRAGMETVYVIEVESGNQEMDLYYSADGVLIKSVADTDNDSEHQYLPNQNAQLSEAMKAFISEKYPNARIVEVDIEDDRNDWDYGYTEVDIIHENISKEVLFDGNGAWFSTSWEVRWNALPQAVQTTVSNQVGYQFDDAEYVESPSGNYYRIELDGRPDKEISVREDGTLLQP